MAKFFKEIDPRVKLVLGGGYANTELRNLADPRVFDFFDFVTLDDGERPLACLLEFIKSKDEKTLHRTFMRVQGEVRYFENSSLRDFSPSEGGTPTLKGLPLQDYLNMFEQLNPVSRLWSETRWNKLTIAHGCYWKKCTFCDVNLDYIGRYEPNSIQEIVDRAESLIQESGQSGFHLVDEACPPAVLKGTSEEIVRRNLTMTWWGNIRFEKAFTPALARQMADAGCVAVTGGLEVASDRLLKLIQKGTSVEQVARVARNFSEAGIFVHAYLIYGFPSQTLQETVDSLEYVRQMFEEGVIQSAFWHRFACTVHSPVGKDPKKYGIEITYRRPQNLFSENDVTFVDPTAPDFDKLGEGLKRALYNYMLGVGLDWDLKKWFEIKVPKTTVHKGTVRRFLL
jgi:radical SAM superfamily enzyme YgiQ (UPF0313 family)